MPKRANTPPRVDKPKTCRYHRNRGHSTNECSALKDKLEELIKQGYLRRVRNIEADHIGLADSPDWRTKIKLFITHGVTPDNPTEAKRLRTQARRYVIITNQLYRRGFSTPLLKCLDTTEADYLMREVHEGICEMHSGARMTVSRLLHAGYYWPTMNTDCSTFVRKCQSCQKYGNLIHQLAEQLHCIPLAWPFAT
uniref:Integrase zinc-binding domain-containing protein n=1 Tax=Cajanus cajan TaxID=3821 RepID=A0A151RDV4_CAJCA|nr:hypothetical protein KK1_037846 [Cajanus cajan]